MKFLILCLIFCLTTAIRVPNNNRPFTFSYPSQVIEPKPEKVKLHLTGWDASKKCGSIGNFFLFATRSIKCTLANKKFKNKNKKL